MKIAFVLNMFPVTTETFIVNQIVDMIKKGHDVSILAYKRNREQVLHKTIVEYNLLDRVTYHGVMPESKFVRLGFLANLIRKNISTISLVKLWRTIRPFRTKKDDAFLGQFFRNQWFLNAKSFDIIHCHFANSGLRIAQLKQEGFLEDPKQVVSFHGYDIDPGKIKKYNTLYEQLYKESSFLTYNSIYTKKLIEQTDVNPAKLRLLPESIDTNFFTKPEVNSKKDVIQIVFCGRLVEFKAPDLAVEIARRLLDKNYNIKLVLIGEGPYRGPLEDIIQKHSLHKSVELRGAISQQAIIDEFAVSDIFLLPGVHEVETGRAENQGLVIQEAQSMELPVVVSTAGGMKNGLVDGETGFVVTEKDIDGFVERLIELIEDEGLRKEMGKKGRAYVVENYNSSYLGDMLVNYYKEVL